VSKDRKSTYKHILSKKSQQICVSGKYRRGRGGSAAECSVILQIGAVSKEEDITAGFFIFCFCGCGAIKFAVQQNPFVPFFTSFDQDNLFEYLFLQTI
jgi:hypothetical protein